MPKYEVYATIHLPASDEYDARGIVTEAITKAMEWFWEDHSAIPEIISVDRIVEL